MKKPPAKQFLSNIMVQEKTNLCVPPICIFISLYFAYVSNRKKNVFILADILRLLGELMS